MFKMRSCALLLLGAAMGVTWARTPPLALQAHAPHTKAPHPDIAVNWGLSGAVTEELWEMYTVRNDSKPPQIVHPSLNGASRATVVVGKHMKTMNERPIFAFQGIKFGEAPVGDKRFKRTVPQAPYWGSDAVLMADHLGKKCPQLSILGHLPTGDEDCLNLNVYTPYLPDDLPEGKLLPVMMFIHGGAFTGGDSSLYLPTKLLDHDVILVPIHYRLGNLGFFSLDNDKAPGNAGLWDQITALEWIRDNIEGFGGDKNRVTIFGESAGGASVNYLMLVEEARGLFHGVIGESGSALEHWSHDPEPVESARAVAGFNGCPTEDLDELYDCMVKMPADVLAKTMSGFVSQDRREGEMGFRGAAPVTQTSTVPAHERLVVKHPKQYFEDGDAADVPLMIGTNKHEGSFVLAIMYSSFLVPNGHINDTEYLLNDMMTDFLNCFGVNDFTAGISESIQDAFVPGLDITNFTVAAPGYVDAAGVFFLKAGGWETAKLHAKHTNSSSFYYSFDFESDDTMFDWLFMGNDGFPFRPGVTHADEMLYLFSFPGELEGQQLVVKDRMVKFWTNFAIYGHPTPEEDRENWEALDIPEWLPVRPEDHKYMLIQDECTVETEFPARWHISLEEDAYGQWESTTEPTESPPGPSWDEHNSVKQERETFLITMIVFIVAFVCAAVLSAFLFMKKRA